MACGLLSGVVAEPALGDVLSVSLLGVTRGDDDDMDWQAVGSAVSDKVHLGCGFDVVEGGLVAVVGGVRLSVMVSMDEAFLLRGESILRISEW